MFEDRLRELSEQVSDLAKKKEITISFAESCTGGLISKTITDLAGCSTFFKGGVVAYHNEIKEQILGVSAKALAKFGAVSEETALDMAKGCKKIIETDIAGSVTGIAGPDGGTDEKPVGTVWFGISYKDVTIADKQCFSGNRESVRYKTAIHLLEMLIKIMTEAR